MAALFWVAGGRSELAFVDLVSSRQTRGPALPAELANALGFSRDGKKLIMAATGAAAPADVWVLDLATRRFTQVTHSPHAGIDLAAGVGNDERVRVAGPAGRERHHLRLGDDDLAAHVEPAEIRLVALLGPDHRARDARGFAQRQEAHITIEQRARPVGHQTQRGLQGHL